MNETLSSADVIVIVGFFIVMLAIGFYFSGRMDNLQDYFSGGRRVPWWLSGASFYMSTFSAFAFVAYSALAYQYGFVAITIFWLTIPAVIVGAYFFAARWRRAATTSPLEYIEERYGRTMRQSLAWLGIPVKVIDDGLKLFAIGTLVSVSLGFPLGYAILVSGTILLAYTFLGGLWAVLITDFVQFIVMIAVVIVLLPLCYREVGGISGFLENVPPGFFALTTEKYTPGYIFAFLILLTLNYSTSWSLVQRYYSVRTDSDARKVGYMVAVLNIIGPPLLFAPAMAARIFLPEIENANDVYALLCKAVLPVGMIGMMIAAMFSATMSMLSSDYNSVAAVLTNDVYRPLVAPNASDRSLVRVGRIVTLVIGVISMGIALLLTLTQGDDDLFRKMVRLFAILLPPIAIPMLLGLTIRSVSNAGALTGLVAGTWAGVWAFAVGMLGAEYEILLKEQVLVSLTVPTTIIGTLVGTLASPRPEDEGQRSTAFFERMEGKVDHAPSDAPTSAGDFSPLAIIGYSVAALGILLVLATLYSVYRESVEGAGVSIVVGTAMALLGITFSVVPHLRTRSATNGE